MSKENTVFTNKIIKEFKIFLLSKKLSRSSVKNYLSDVKRYLKWISKRINLVTPEKVTDIKFAEEYKEYLLEEGTSKSSINRTIASLKNLGQMVENTYSRSNPLRNLDRLGVKNDQNPLNNYIKVFTKYLKEEQLSNHTIKAYKSDIGQYLNWIGTTTSSNRIGKLLTEKNIKKYLKHLSNNTDKKYSTIERKSKSLLRLLQWSTLEDTPKHIADITANNHSLEHSTRGRDKSKPTLFSRFSQTILATWQPALSLIFLLVFSISLSIFGYRQVSRDKVILSQAYPNTPTRPGRQLSFQGRLEDSTGTPITTATNILFKLFNNAETGTELYSSGTCEISPDADGVFSVQIGNDCGDEIGSQVFTENTNVWLEVTVASETLSPRQQIATVAYALNSETLQGLPLSSTLAALRSTVVAMNRYGEVILGEQSPTLKSVSGTFGITGPSISITTSTGTNGNITLAPDGTGSINLIGNTTTSNFLNITNAQLTTGSLIRGYVGNNNTGFNLLKLSAGSTEENRFVVDASGNATLSGTLSLAPILQIDAGTCNASSEGKQYYDADQNKYYFCDGSTWVEVGGGSSLWTDDTTITYLTETTDDLAVGGSTLASPFSIDVSENTVRIGDASTGNANLSLYASDGDVGSILYNTSDQFNFAGGDVKLDQSLIVTSDVAINGGDLTTSAVTFNLLPNPTTLNIGASATTVSVGSTTGTTRINNSLDVDGTTNDVAGALNLSGGSLTSTGALTITPQAANNLNIDLSTTGDLAVNTNQLYVDTSFGFTGIGTATPDSKLHVVGGDTYLAPDTGYTFDNTSPGEDLYVYSNLEVDGTIYGTLSGSFNPGFTPGSIAFAAADGSLTEDNTNFFWDDTSKLLGIGDNTPDHTLDVNGNIGLTASGYINWGDTTGTTGYGFRDNAGAIEFKDSLGTWQPIGTGAGDSYWRLSDALGTISPVNDTLDLLVGGEATSSARAGFLNIDTLASGTPTATVSAGITGGAYISADGTFATTTAQDLTLGSSETGNLNFSPGGSTAMFIMANGDIGIGTDVAIPQARLELNTPTATKRGLIVQTTDDSTVSNLIELQDSGGSARGYVTGDLRLVLNPTTFSDFNDTLLTAGTTYTDTAGSGELAQLNSVYNASTNTGSVNYRGLNVLVSNTSAAGISQVDSSVAAGRFSLTHSGTGILSNAKSADFYLNVGAGAGTLTNAYGGYFNEITTSGGTITNAYGIYIDDQSAGGTNYALYSGLGDISIGDDLLLRNDNDILQIGESGDLDLYHDGTDSYITNATGDLIINSATGDLALQSSSGSVGIGTVAPAFELDVRGDASISSTLSLGPMLQIDAGTCDVSSEGKQYYDADENNYYYCNGSGWVAVGTGVSAWTDGGTYLYPTDGEVIGNATSGGANKLAGIYLADSAPLVFGTDNDSTLSFATSTLSWDIGTTDINIDSNTLYISGTNDNVGIGTSNPGNLLTVGAYDAGTSSTLKQNLLSVDNLQLSQLEGGTYFGAVGVKENQWGLSNYGNTWTQKATSLDWTAIAMSSDGKIQTGGTYAGYIWVSTDYGATWTQKATLLNWSSVAMSSDGKIQTATVSSSGYIWVSTDYGDTWTQKATLLNWSSVDMSSDGKIQSATVYGGYIWVSTDYGATWTQKATALNWRSVAMSSDGKIQTGVVNAGYIWVSTDYGETWVQKGSSLGWRSVAMSSDGKIQTAVISGGGYIWVSTDYGATWTQKGSSLSWYSVAMSSDGKIQSAVIYAGYIWVSSDYGETWTQKATSLNWLSVAMSSDGKIQSAAPWGDYIYTSFADSYINGYVGIGDSSPTSQLVVGDDTTATNVSGAGDAYIQNDLEVDGAIYLSNELYFTPLTSSSSTTEGTVFYDDDVDHLYLYGGDSSWHRVALDMTKYSETNAAVANQSYIEIAHGQGTNDLTFTAWIYDTTTSLWEKITDWAKSITHDLDNEFNAEHTQKEQVTAVSLDKQVDNFGNGADGAITVSSDTSINATDLIAFRSCADGGDAVTYTASALTSTTATLSTTPSSGCLAVGDEILLINVRGTSTAYGNVGNYETLRIESIATDTITFTTTKQNYYGDGATDDTNLGITAGTQIVMVQRVPNYTTVTVDNGFNFYPDDFATGSGVIFFRATGAVTVNGTIHADGKGYRGGTGGTSLSDGGESFCDADGGGDGGLQVTTNGSDGLCGGGGGGGGRGDTSTTTLGGSGTASLGGGGGGGGRGYDSTGEIQSLPGGGAGGGYGIAGTGGKTHSLATDGTDGGTTTSGDGGDGGQDATYGAGGGGGGGGTYGDTQLTQLFHGSGGAQAGMGYIIVGASGGDGGGIIYIAADSITVSGTISSDGGAGAASGGANDSGSGGGAGGSVKLLGDTLAIGVNLVDASGGAGGTAASYDGGAGGDGRMAIGYSSSMTGSTSSPVYAPLSLEYNPYALYISEEIHTPGTTAFNTISWTETLELYTEVQVQTRSGATTDSTDGTWESWKPHTLSTDYYLLESADTHTNWTGTNLTVAEGDVARNVDFFEDEDESNSGNLTKTTSTTADGYAEATIASTSITGFDYISLWVRSAAEGQVLTIGMGETVATEQEETFYIDKANSWQKIYWDISDIVADDRNAITKLRITNITSGNVIYFDNVKSESMPSTESGSPITSTANEYIQYRLLLSTTSGSATPAFSDVMINLTNTDGTYTIDANSIIDPNAKIENQTARPIEPEILDYAIFDTGTGTDGPITVSSSTDITATSLISGRVCAGDAVNYNVSSLTSTTATLSTTPVSDCLVVGDEVLLINLEGTSTAYDNVGNYEALKIESIATNVVTFTTAKQNYYGDGASDDTNLGTANGTQRVMLQRVPNYTTVTVNTGINFYPDDWNTSKGGVMFFRATGAVAVDGTGSIHADGKGYGGGSGGASLADGGESFCDQDGGGDGGLQVTTNGADGLCGGGGAGGGRGDTSTTTLGGSGTPSLGGAGGGGGRGYDLSGETYSLPGGAGGGGYGTAGTGGNSWQGGVYNGVDGDTNISGDGGDGYQDATYGMGGGGGGGGTYGDTQLTQLFHGSGGAQAGMGYIIVGASGGDGGGIIYIAADSITVSGTISSDGGAGAASGGANDSGSGGGAGGSVKLLGDTLAIGVDLVDASGGAGGTAASYDGGAGGNGRMTVYYATSATGSTSSPAYVADSTSDSYNPYKIYPSKEIATTGATSFGNIEWTENLPSGTEIELQTRSGATSNSTDGTWEAWKPTTTSLTLNDATTHTDWTGTNATVAEGDVTRDIDYYEDEDEATATNLTKFTTTAAGGYAEHTKAAGSWDFSTTPYQYLTFWVRSATAGNVITFGFGEAAATEKEQAVKITTADTWQKVYWDLSSACATATDCDGVTVLRTTSSEDANVVYLDDVKVENYLTTPAGSTITSTADDYIQYRAILTTTTTSETPTFSEVRINYNDGSAQVVNDRLANQNDTDQYDQSTRLAITTIELDDYKSSNIKKQETSFTLNAALSPGTGADGDITVSSDTNINDTSLITGRSCSDGGDAPRYNLSALTSRTATTRLIPSTGCLAVGDEILLINHQGTSTAYDNVGNWETLRVESIEDNVVTFTTAKTKYYGDGSTNDTNIGTGEGEQNVGIYRVPNYRNVTVDSGYNFYPDDFGGSGGGVMFFRATGAVAINGTIHADGKGYWGGSGGGVLADGGEAFCGSTGGGDGGQQNLYDGDDGLCGGGGGGGGRGDTSTSTLGGSGTISLGGGGGGGGRAYDSGGETESLPGGGGGGGYGTFGYRGLAAAAGSYGTNGGTRQSGDGGDGSYDATYGIGGGGGGGGTYGDADLTKLMLGSGGGEAGYGYAQDGANGGDGGGIVYIAANSITVNGLLSSDGGAGSASGGTNVSASGGGSGGSIKLLGNIINTGTTNSSGDNKTRTYGGDGGSSTATSYDGGDGGAGRIAISYGSSYSGSTSPTAQNAEVPTYNYAAYVSDEIATPDATEYNRISWWGEETPFGTIQVQTRSGASNNSLDGTWEEWKPIVSGTNYTSIDTANTHTDWLGTGIGIEDGGSVTRDVNYFEDEDESTGSNTSKLKMGFSPDDGNSLTTSMEAYWNLDEESGTRSDLIGSNDLTDNATVTYDTGIQNNAGQFTATNLEYLSIADNASLSTGDIDYSLSAWVYMDSTPVANTNILAKKSAAGADDEYWLYWEQATGELRFAVYNIVGAVVGSVSTSTFGALSTGTWYHVVAYHDSVAGTVNIAINDGTVDSSATTGVIGDGTGGFVIGAEDDDGGAYWDGRIDEVGFWKKVLTSQEITDLYNSGASSEYYPVTSGSNYAEDRIVSTDLTNYDYITAWINSNESGNTVKLGFGETTATEHEILLNLDTTDAWQKVYWDISHIPDHERDAIRQLRITALGTVEQHIYFDNIEAERLLNTPEGSTISSKPNEFIQYRVILASSNPAYFPVLYNIQAEWSNGFKVEQTDTNTVRLYNYTGETQQLRLDAIVFGADLAEWYTIEDDFIEAGDVVATTGRTDIFGVPILKKATYEDQKSLIGAISTQAGKTLGLEADNRRLLGLAGRIPIKIDPSSPTLKNGDYITASPNIPGTGFKASPGDAVIGKTFQSWNPPENGEDITTVLSYITEPGSAPIFNAEALINHSIEKLADNYFAIENTATGRIIEPVGIFANAMIANLKAGRIETEELDATTATIANLSINILSPLASGSAITLSGPTIIKNNSATPSGEPLLKVEGEINAATISARTAILEEITATKIKADEIEVGSITADNIVGLEDKVATLAGQTINQYYYASASATTLSDEELASITDRIKDRIASLTAEESTAEDIPQEETIDYIATDVTEATASSNLADSSLDLDDLNIYPTLSADMVTINDYLAVIGQATITTLSVNNTLYTNSITAKSNTLSLQPLGGTIKLAANTMIIDSSGNVTINGDLSVNGNLYANNASFNTLSLGQSKEASSSALGKLLAIYNEQGEEVATINASGSANLKDLTTQLITIASSSEASQSATASALAQAISTATASNATAGEAILEAPNTELTIESPFVDTDSLIYLTPTSPTFNNVLYVKQKQSCEDILYSCTPSFTVAISQPIPQNLTFNWWIIKLK